MIHGRLPLFEIEREFFCIGSTDVDAWLVQCRSIAGFIENIRLGLGKMPLI
jgi:hypothetical protein